MPDNINCVKCGDSVTCGYRDSETIDSIVRSIDDKTNVVGDLGSRVSY